MSAILGYWRQQVLIRMSDLRIGLSPDGDKNRGQRGKGPPKPLKGKEKNLGQHRKWCNF
jgi:hypothetical protein